VQSQADPVPLIIHHGYCGLPQWQDFVSNKDPNYLIMEDHPYAGTFDSNGSEDEALGAVCDKASSYVSYPIPVIVTEVTLRFNLPSQDSSFANRMWAQQISAYGASGGSTFWSLQ